MPAIVDADVHHMLSLNDLLTPYLPESWARSNEQFGLRYPDSIGYFATRPRHFACRTDAWPPNGGVPGGDLDFMCEQLLDAWPIEAAILNPINQTTCGSQFVEFAAALTRALRRPRSRESGPTSPTTGARVAAEARVARSARATCCASSSGTGPAAPRRGLDASCSARGTAGRSTFAPAARGSTRRSSASAGYAVTLKELEARPLHCRGRTRSRSTGALSS